jgi:hypothetical protein
MVGRGKGTCIRHIAGCAFTRTGRLKDLAARSIF